MGNQHTVGAHNQRVRQQQMHQYPQRQQAPPPQAPPPNYPQQQQMRVGPQQQQQQLYPPPQQPAPPPLAHQPVSPHHPIQIYQHNATPNQANASPLQQQPPAQFQQPQFQPRPAPLQQQPFNVTLPHPNFVPFGSPNRPPTIERQNYAYGVYVGTFNSRLEKHGHGRLVTRQGTTYDGEWVENSMHGIGNYTWPDGRRYHGTVYKNCFQGYGEYTWPEGHKFSGQFHEDKLMEGTFYVYGLPDQAHKVAWQGVSQATAKAAIDRAALEASRGNRQFLHTPPNRSQSTTPVPQGSNAVLQGIPQGMPRSFSTENPPPPSVNGLPPILPAPKDGWSCTACTLINEKEATQCSICSTSRPETLQRAEIAQPEDDDLEAQDDDEINHSSLGHACVFCLKEPREVVVIPCGHLCLCEGCGKLQHDGCPLCRKPIREVMRVFT